MDNANPRNEALNLIRFSGLLWLAYLLALAFIGRTFQGAQMTNPLYYVLLGCVAAMCFLLSYWSWAQARLGQAFLPLIIVIITVAPIISQLTPRLVPLGPHFTSPESSVLATFPFLLVGFLLVAWQYRWQYMLIIILVIFGVNIALLLSKADPGSPPFQGGLVIIIIQTVIFLAVGFSVSYLMSRLRGQQQSLQAANTQLVHYADTLEQLATSRERNRVARELHDTLAHTLSGLSVQLETIAAYWDIDPKTARSMLADSLAATHSGLEETRRALKALRATPLEDLGLPIALSTMAKDITSRANINLNLLVSDSLPLLAPDVEQCVYRIAQEAITNAVEHSAAKKLDIELKRSDGGIELTIADDGTGFDVDKGLKAGHFGLTGMRERAHLIGGELDIISRPGHGTCIRLKTK